MRVLHLTDHWLLGGVPQVVASLAGAQHARGHGVVVAAGTSHPKAPSLAVPFTLAPGLRSSGQVGNLVRAAWTIRRLVSSIRPDILHVHQRGLALAAGLSRPGVPVVEHAHSEFHDRILTSYRSESVVAVGSSIREAVCVEYRRPYERVRVIPNGVADLEAVGLPGNLAAGFVIGAIGRLSPEKDPLRFVATIATLARRGQPVSGLWLGDGPLAQEFDRASDGLAVERLVSGLPIGDFLGQIHCLLVTSRREGLPLAILEAFSAGRPVVATDVGSVRDAVVDGMTGRLVPADASPNALADAVQTVVTPVAFEAMARRSRQSYEQSFAVDMVVDQVEAAYSEALRRRGSGDSS